MTRLPQLFRQLMQVPLQPLRHGTLPDAEALYVFYYDQDPISVGSVPHIDQTRLLWPSVRLGLRLQPGQSPVTEAPPSIRQQQILQARWLKLIDAEDRKLLELFAAQSLGLSITHPELIAGLKNHSPTEA